MHITNQKLHFDIYSREFKKYRHVTWSLLNMNEFWYKRQIDNFDPYIELLVIATNIPVQLKTGFMVQDPNFDLSEL